MKKITVLCFFTVGLFSTLSVYANSSAENLAADLNPTSSHNEALEVLSENFFREIIDTEVTSTTTHNKVLDVTDKILPVENTAPEITTILAITEVLDDFGENLAMENIGDEINTKPVHGKTLEVDNENLISDVLVIKTDQQLSLDEVSYTTNENLQVTRWNTWENLSSLGTLIAALATLAIAYLTLISTKHAKASADAANLSAQIAQNSIDVTRNAYIASERPWVSVQAGINSDLVKGETGIDFGIDYLVKNSGNSPAINVHIVYEVATLKVERNQFSDARQRTDNLGSFSDIGTNMGIQLFPSEEKIISWKSPLLYEEIEKGQTNWTRKNAFLPSFSIIGSVFYQSAFDETIYKTGFKFDIFAFNVRGDNSLSDVPDFETVFPKNRLVLRSSSFCKGVIN